MPSSNLHRPPVGWIVPLGIFLCLLCSPSQGQDSIIEFISPRFGTIRGLLEYSVDHDLEQGISDQPFDFSMTSHQLRLPGYRWLEEDHELLVGGSLRLLDISTGAMLLDTLQSFPEYLAEPELTVAYKQRISGPKIWGLSLTLGSPSDRPFDSIHEIAVDGNAFLRLPVGQADDAWLLFLNYSNTSQFLQNVPLPGIAYIHEPSEDLLAIVGVPFMYVKYKPLPRWTLQASYILLRNVHAQASYELLDNLSIYGGFDWDADVFLRHDRIDNDDRMFYYHKSLSAGTRWNITEDFYLDFSAGYRFGRFFFEGEDYDDRGFNRVDIGDGPFLALRVGLELGGPAKDSYAHAAGQ